MKKYTLLHYALFCIVLFASAGYSIWCLERELWVSFIVCLTLFVTTSGIAYFTFFNKKDMRHALNDVAASYRAKIFKEAERQQFYELVLKLVETGVVACGKDGHVEWMNRCAEDMLGMPRQVEKEWLNAAEAERVVHLVRHSHHYDCLLTRMPFREGETEKLIFTLRDIRHVLEAKQQESWKSLSRVLTHEIMNSMTPILSLVDTLVLRTNADQTPTAEILAHMQQGLKVIHRRGQGLLDFVNNYRQLTHVPPPRLAIIKADDFFADLRKLFPAPYIEFKQPYRDFSFRADRSQLEQVLINLIKNALEAATRKNSPVQVELSRNVERHEVFIRVQDHGHGIAAAEQDHVFMPFYTTKQGGSGIGLSLCKQIINNHGGDIRLHSVADSGSCFTVCLPY